MAAVTGDKTAYPQQIRRGSQKGAYRRKLPMRRMYGKQYGDKQHAQRSVSNQICLKAPAPDFDVFVTVVRNRIADKVRQERSRQRDSRVS